LYGDAYKKWNPKNDFCYLPLIFMRGINAHLVHVDVSNFSLCFDTFVINRLYTSEYTAEVRRLTVCVRGAWRWGGRGFCLGVEKTRSQKNAWDVRRIPSV